MFRQIFFIHNHVLYQETDIDDGYYSLPTLVLDDLELTNGLLIIIQLLTDIYERTESIRFLNVAISVYMLEVSQDIILIYPTDSKQAIKDEFLELCKEDLFELYNLLTEHICDSK